MGSGGVDDIPAVGNTANVVGLVKEFNGLTEIDATVDGGSVADGGAATPIAPRTGVLPGTIDRALPGTTCLTGTALAAVQEAFEGELWQPLRRYTATDAYDGSAFGGDAWGTSSSSSMFGEIGLAANSDQPLIVPTEVIDAQDAPGVAARTAYNKAHQLVLDDASSITYWNTTGTGRDDLPFPWFTPANPVRVGASVSFAAPMIYTDSFGTRRLIPVEQVTDDGSSVGVDFTNTRPDVAADVAVTSSWPRSTCSTSSRVSAAEFVALNPATNSCTPFLDRDDNPIAVNSCNPNGPRGAWDDTNLRRQRSKIVKSINAIDADVVSLEEIENSVQFGRNRDDAVGKLVAALNTDAGGTVARWAFVPSPAAADLPPLAEQDVIRNALIYNPATVRPVGASKVLVGNAGVQQRPRAACPGLQDPWHWRRRCVRRHQQPLQVQGIRSPDPDGQGNATVDRVGARPTVSWTSPHSSRPIVASSGCSSWAISTPTARRTRSRRSRRVSTTPAATATTTPARRDNIDGTESYSFSGLSGSLDHVFANAAAPGRRHRRRRGRHQRQRVGRSTSTAASTTTSRDCSTEPDLRILRPQPGGRRYQPVPTAVSRIQILGTNDFHGRIATTDRRRGRCGRPGRCRQAAARRRTRTRCSPPPVT